MKHVATSLGILCGIIIAMLPGLAGWHWWHYLATGPAGLAVMLAVLAWR